MDVYNSEISIEPCRNLVALIEIVVLLHLHVLANLWQILFE